jgi:hypothetical protein
MSIATQDPIQPKTLTSSDRMVTLVVVVCAMLIGSSAGILVADRDILGGSRPAAAAKSIVPAASQASTSPSVAKPAANSRETKPAAAKSMQILQPLTSSLQTVDSSDQSESASFDLELGTAFVVRADKVHDPERIYFDLRDSDRAEGTMDQLAARAAVQIRGNLVAGVRASEWKSGAARLVLDLTRPCDYTYKLSPSSHLLISLKARTPGSTPAKN